MKLSRRLKYYYLRFIGLRGEPRELALGAALGIFSGLLPIMPFQTAVAITLAVFFRASKITAALGTWISNPLNWYFHYYYSYKIGTLLLGLTERSAVFSAVTKDIREGENALLAVGKILGAGTTTIAAFLLGGVILGFVFAVPSYYLLFPLFRTLKSWRERRKEEKRRRRMGLWSEENEGFGSRKD